MPPSGPSPTGTGTKTSTSADLVFGHCLLRPAARQLLVDGQVAAVGARAFDLLQALVERRERVVSKDELLDLVWPGVVVEENNLQVQISALRKLLGPALITTVAGHGYRFAAHAGPAVAASRGLPPVATLPAATLPPLFGREHDLQTLHYLLQAHRLVSIVGAGGIGKTALARAVAAQQTGRFADATVFVDLAPLRQAQDLPPCIAAALHPWPARPFDGLLLLDNCEHLIHAVAEWAAAALARWPGLHILATSQEPLHLGTEQVYRVSVLALPAGPTLPEAQAASAVRLFEARVRSADPRFALDAGNAALVVAICRQLDGVALAIELAAARVPHLGLQGLHDRLGQRLRVLATASRATPTRQRTLGAALAWSHALLSAAEQTALRRLAVMCGSFSPGSAQSVLADATLDAWDVMDLVGALVDKSLVSVDALAGPVQATAAGHAPQAAEPRLQLLETVRQFALERLAEAGEEVTTRNRHLAHMLDLAERAGSALSGPEEGAWLNRLDLDRDNLLAAHAWCEHAPEGTARGLRLVAALQRYWFNRGRLAQGHHLCSLALSRPGAAEQGLLYGQALFVAGRISAGLGHDAEALARLQASAEVAQRCNDPALRVRALSWLGSVCAQQGQRAAARLHAQDALSAARQTPAAPDLLVVAANGLAELERLEGRLDAAQPLYEEALRRARSLGDRLSTLALLANLCMVALAQPAAVLSESPTTAPSAANLKLVGQRLLEALAIADELDSARGRLTVLEVCAGLTCVQGAWAQALRWDAAATHHLAALGRQRDATDQAFLTPWRDRACAVLGASEAAVAQAQGADLPLAMALDQARQSLHALRSLVGAG